MRFNLYLGFEDMKLMIVILVSIILSGCISTPDTKLFIKSIQVDNTKRVDWYFFSLIGDFSQSYLQYEDKEKGQRAFFKSFFLSDFNKQGDTLTIQLWSNDYELDKMKFTALGLVVRIDTTGDQWNQASSRLDRLRQKNVDIKHYHFEDSYCAKGECY